jgi:hypothetical protein
MTAQRVTGPAGTAFVGLSASEPSTARPEAGGAVRPPWSLPNYLQSAVISSRQADAVGDLRVCVVDMSTTQRPPLPPDRERNQLRALGRRR